MESEVPNIFNVPPNIQAELDELETQLDRVIPAKELDRNILIATWNIRAFGDLTRKWASAEEDSPRRDLHSLQIITRIIRRFDVIALQEVKSNIRALRDMLKLLGENWSFTLTDVTEGSAGNGERMAFIFDTRRIKLSGLAGELVVPEERLNNIEQGALRKQFARTPYAVSFRSETTTFILVTLHILYGSNAKERIPELKAIADWMADWASDIHAYHHNLIALGDFNVDERGDVLHQTFISSGLFIPQDLGKVTRSIFDAEKFYDHIAWFLGRKGVPELSMNYSRGGNFDFLPFVFKNRDLNTQQISWMISDHYPLWAEFVTRQFFSLSDSLATAKLKGINQVPDFELCYCSVYEDCWITKGLSVQPSRICRQNPHYLSSAKVLQVMIAIKMIDGDPPSL